MTLPRAGRRPRLIVRMDEEPGPTPETRAKLRPDRLKELFAAGLIDQQHFVAGGEIREIVDSVSAMYLRPISLGGPDKTGSGPRHPMDGMPPHLVRLHRRKYLPWVKAMEQPKLRGVSYAQLVIGIVVDCHECSDYSDGPLDSKNRAVVALREALDAYI